MATLKTMQANRTALTTAAELRAEYLAAGTSAKDKFVEYMLLRCYADPDIYFALLDTKSPTSDEEQLTAIAAALNEEATAA